jgi:streptogramin lyase
MTSTNIQAVSARFCFTAPGQQVNGLEAVSDGLWLCDQRDGRAYLVDFAGAMLTSFASPARNASGITVGGGSVWISSNVSPAMIFRHDAVSGHCTGYLLLAGEGGVHGLQWRSGGAGASGTLWVSRPGAHRIDHIDAESGELLGSLAFPADRSHGMFWDERDGTLSVAETNHGHVLRFDPQSGDLLEEWHIEGAEVHGFSRSGDGRIWVGDASTNQVLVVTR